MTILLLLLACDTHRRSCDELGLYVDDHTVAVCTTRPCWGLLVDEELYAFDPPLADGDTIQLCDGTLRNVGVTVEAAVTVAGAGEDATTVLGEDTDEGAGTSYPDTPPPQTKGHCALSLGPGQGVRDLTLASPDGLYEADVDEQGHSRTTGNALCADGDATLERVTIADTILDQGSLTLGGAFVMGSQSRASSSTAQTITVRDSTLVRNRADIGGAVLLTPGSTLVSENTDWGEGEDDNQPDDLGFADFTRRNPELDHRSYGANASFTCTFGLDLAIDCE